MTADYDDVEDSDSEAEDGGITKRTKLDIEKRETDVDVRDKEGIAGDDHIVMAKVLATEAMENLPGPKTVEMTNKKG